MDNLNKDMTSDQILNEINRYARGEVGMLHAGPCFLQYKLHQELFFRTAEGS